MNSVCEIGEMPKKSVELA